MQAWAGGAEQMDVSLFSDLVAHGTALVVMQRLEAKHHLVSQKVGRGRRSLPGAISAELRRRLNADIHTESFRQLLPDLLPRLGELTPQEVVWNTKGELKEWVYGYARARLFEDMSAFESVIAANLKRLRATRGADPLPGTIDKMAHARWALEPGTHLAVPCRDGSHVVVEVVCTAPGPGFGDGGSTSQPTRA